MNIKTYCINQDFRLDRWIHFQKQIEKYDLGFLNPTHVTPVSRQEVILKSKRTKTKIAEMSNVYTFGNCIKKSNEERLDLAITFEDDVFFINKDSSTIIKNILEQLPEHFGVCYLGCYMRSKPNSCSLKQYSDNLMELQGNKFTIWGAHAVIWNKDIFSLSISEMFKPGKPLITDSMIYKKIVNGGNHRCFVAHPQIAFQNGDLIKGGSMHGKFNFKKMMERSIKLLG